MDWITISQFIGAILSVGLASIGSGIGEGYIAGKADESITRQPQAASDIARTLLITQAVTETASIFGLLIAVILLFMASSEGGVFLPISYVSAGLCMGLGGLGAGIGSGFVGGEACESVGRHPRITSGIMLTALVGQAVVQTGCIFALVVSIMLSTIPLKTPDISVIGAMFGACLSMGFGSIGPAISSGYTAEKALWGISRNSNHIGIITRTMLLGQAVTQSSSIFPLIVAFILIIFSGMM